MTAAGSHLAKIHAARTSAALEKAITAVREMEATGSAINFSAVAKRAGVGRAFLYNSPQLREEIERLREASPTQTGRVPASERVSLESLRSRLRASQGENQRLRAEVFELREELALAHGTIRQLRNGRG